MLAIFPLYDRKNRQVILGIGEEMMKRLESLNLGSSSAARPPYTRRSMRRPLNMSLRICSELGNECLSGLLGRGCHYR